MWARPIICLTAWMMLVGLALVCTGCETPPPPGKQRTLGERRPGQSAQRNDGKGQAGSLALRRPLRGGPNPQAASSPAKSQPLPPQNQPGLPQAAHAVTGSNAVKHSSLNFILAEELLLSTADPFASKLPAPKAPEPLAPSPGAQPGPSPPSSGMVADALSKAGLLGGRAQKPARGETATEEDIVSAQEEVKLVGVVISPQHPMAMVEINEGGRLVSLGEEIITPNATYRVKQIKHDHIAVLRTSGKKALSERIYLPDIVGFQGSGNASSNNGSVTGRERRSPMRNQQRAETPAASPAAPAAPSPSAASSTGLTQHLAVPRVQQWPQLPSTDAPAPLPANVLSPQVEQVQVPQLIDFTQAQPGPQ